jgi:hypothetical protein
MNTETMTRAQKAAATRARKQAEENKWVAESDLADVGHKIRQLHMIARGGGGAPIHWATEARADLGYLRRAMDSAGITEDNAMAAYWERSERLQKEAELEEEFAKQMTRLQLLLKAAMLKDPGATIEALEKIAETTV